MRKISQIQFAYAVWCTVILFLGACSALSPVLKQLEEVKAHSSQEDYTWIAEKEISCDASDEGCNQLHLIKGDACFRLAKQEESAEKKAEARAHYECAVTHLETGIKQTTNWQQGVNLNLDRPQTYENLCEALRGWQDLETGEAAAQLTQRLFRTAQEFLTAEPGNLAAIYFLNSARFTMLRKDLLQPEAPQALCEKLNKIIQALDDGMQRAEGGRYEANYRRLRLDVAGAKQIVPGCQ